MKKNLLLFITVLFTLQGFSQLSIMPGAQWVNSGNVVVTLKDVDLVNNGTFTAGNSIVKFTGTADKSIGGNSVTAFYELETEKTNNSKISLLSNINVNNRITFTSGLLDLNQHNITLASAAILYNERESSHIIGPNGGETVITVNMAAPNSTNAGNLGAVITSTANLGAVLIKRGHTIQSGTGLTSSANRYFDIEPANNINLDATLRFVYFDAELNLQNENIMVMYRSTDNGINWLNQPVNSRDAVLNYVEKTGITAFSRWAVSSNGSGPLPVVDLQFFAKRISSSKVQLDWKTSQEINNQGFYIERKKQNENSFANLGFVNSLAPGGNSSFPLQYSKTDDNNFSGTTFYRLKQQDINGNFVYSAIRVVKGDISKSITLKAWPIPSAGNLTVTADGIDKDILQVFDTKGRLIKQQDILNQSQIYLTNLAPGTYIIRLAGQKDISQKIIVQ
ncbi:MAG: T9SS type A sorting domain-containing protein [Ferruginibacter sp.]